MRCWQRLDACWWLHSWQVNADRRSHHLPCEHGKRKIYVIETHRIPFKNRYAWEEIMQHLGLGPFNSKSRKHVARVKRESISLTYAVGNPINSGIIPSFLQTMKYPWQKMRSKLDVPWVLISWHILRLYFAPTVHTMPGYVYRASCHGISLPVKCRALSIVDLLPGLLAGGARCSLWEEKTGTMRICTA